MQYKGCLEGHVRNSFELSGFIQSDPKGGGFGNDPGEPEEPLDKICYPSMAIAWAIS